MADLDDFDAVRQDTDPLRRAQRAAALAVQYQQRAVELSRLRKVAVEQAHDELGLSYTEIAAALGVSKGRITQIRGAAPGRERAFFGVGPVSVGVPLRRGTDHRMRTYIDASDATAQEMAESILVALALTARRFTIEPDRTDVPPGDAIVICGPRSAPIGARLLARDSHLQFVKEDQWRIEDRTGGGTYRSPRFADASENVDYGYFSRHRDSGRIVLHVAGITAVGSAGVLHFLQNHVRQLFDELGDSEFSMVVRCAFTDDTSITSSELAAGPHRW